jgi:uncharacterized spore protein YtfJ
VRLCSYSATAITSGVNTMSNEQMLMETASRLKEFLSTDNVMGAPVDLGEKVVIPIARFGFGFGAGGSQGKDGGGQGSGGGGGIEPVALVILHKDVKGPEGVQIMSLKKDNPIAQIISALSETLAPQVIDAIKSMNQDRAKVSPAKKEEL